MYNTNVAKVFALIVGLGKVDFDEDATRATTNQCFRLLGVKPKKGKDVESMISNVIDVIETVVNTHMTKDEVCLCLVQMETCEEYQYALSDGAVLDEWAPYGQISRILQCMVIKLGRSKYTMEQNITDSAEIKELYQDASELAVVL